MIKMLLHSSELECSSTLEVSFEFEFDTFIDEKMTFYRNMAVALYYVMIAIIVVQFFVLLIRNVTFLPLWTLIEYM
jgi:hypothetical protein